MTAFLMNGVKGKPAWVFLTTRGHPWTTPPSRCQMHEAGPSSFTCFMGPSSQSNQPQAIVRNYLVTKQKLGYARQQIFKKSKLRKPKKQKYWRETKIYNWLYQPSLTFPRRQLFPDNQATGRLSLSQYCVCSVAWVLRDFERLTFVFILLCVCQGVHAENQG